MSSRYDAPTFGARTPPSNWPPAASCVKNLGCLGGGELGAWRGLWLVVGGARPDGPRVGAVCGTAEEEPRLPPCGAVSHDGPLGLFGPAFGGGHEDFGGWGFDLAVVVEVGGRSGEALFEGAPCGTGARVRSEVVAEEQGVTGVRAAVQTDMGVGRAVSDGGGEDQLFASMAVRGLHAVPGLGTAAEACGFQHVDDIRGKLGDSDLCVYAVLGSQTGNGRGPDVVDRYGSVTQCGMQPPRQAGELPGPAGVVVDDRDGGTELIRERH